MHRLDFVCFSRDVWGKRLSRKHLLMTFLAENENVGKVLYIEPAINLVRLFVYPFSELGEKENRARWKRALLCKLVKLDEKLFLFTPLFFIPLHRFPVIYNLNRFISLLFVRAKIKKLELCNIVLWLYHPWDFCILKWFKNRIISCFDWALDWTSYHIELSEKERKRMRKLELSVVKNVDIVFAISQKLLNTALEYNSKSFLLPSGANPELYRKARGINKAIPNDIVNIKKPILGYIGALAGNIDIDLLKYISRKLSYCSIVLIGQVLTAFDLHSFDGIDNIHFLGLKRYEELPSYVKYFDVCLIPYKIKFAWNESADSTKMYDYLASGKPIVSVPTAGVNRFKDYIKIAETKEEFVQCVDECLKENDPELPSLRIKIAEENSWSIRTKQVISIIKNIYSIRNLGMRI